jgi:hypothetical protein
MVMKKTKTTNQAWGIIRYAPVPGLAPDEDPCAFDGWYTGYEIAHEIYKYWCEDYPDWIVALISADQVRFSDKVLQLSPYNRARLRVLHGKGRRPPGAVQPMGGTPCTWAPKTHG